MPTEWRPRPGAGSGAVAYVITGCPIFRSNLGARLSAPTAGVRVGMRRRACFVLTAIVSTSPRSPPLTAAAARERETECSPGRTVERSTPYAVGRFRIRTGRCGRRAGLLREHCRVSPLSGTGAVVPGAILSICCGGDKDWGRFPPYPRARYAARRPQRADFALGRRGPVSERHLNLKAGLDPLRR